MSEEANDRAVLGIHSWLGEGGAIDGHAWITVTRNGQTDSFGLWPKDHARVQAIGNPAGWNLSGTSIQRGLEDDYPPDASRYIELSKSQERQLNGRLEESGWDEKWTLPNNCATWSTGVYEDVSGEKLHARDEKLLYLVKTPNELNESLERMESLDSSQDLRPPGVMESKHHERMRLQETNEKSRSTYYDRLQLERESDSPTLKQEFNKNAR